MAKVFDANKAQFKIHDLPYDKGWFIHDDWSGAYLTNLGTVEYGGNEDYSRYYFQTGEAAKETLAAWYGEHIDAYINYVAEKLTA